MGSLLRNVFDGLVTTDINYIHYAIYLPPNKSTHTQLDQTRSSILSFIKPFLKDYLWQKDGFQLSITHNNKKDPLYPFLFGVTRFGDCLHDEWCIIYLLYEISKQFSEVIITVSDNDGDVLLIEAALELPSWLDPSNSENRVYIYQGQLHIIPLPKSPTDIFNMIPSTNKSLSRQQGLDYIRQNKSSSSSSIASTSIQQVIHQRIKDYPDSQLHYARTYFHSLKAAWILLNEPQLLTLAIESFYLRDPISLKHCITMSTFLPSNKNNKMMINEQKQQKSMDIVIPWTRTTFAQTLHQSFYPPKSFPSFNKDDPDFMMKDIGMKLTCGLEMLYHQLKQQQKEKGKLDNHGDNNDLEDDDDDDLVTRDDLFKQVKLQNGGMTPLERIDQLLNDYSIDKLNQLLSTMKNKREKEDGLDWLYVYPDELESILNNKMDREEVEQLDEGKGRGQDPNMPIDLEEMMKKFEFFLEKNQSDVNGVLLPEEQEDDRDDEENDEMDNENTSHEYNDDIEEDLDQQISFDFNNFMKILNQGINNNDTLEDINVEKTEVLDDMMKQMDKEISEYDKISGSFKREEDEDKPVNIELNLIENVLQSFKGQQGLPGPAGNLLKQFGITLPVDFEENDDDESANEIEINK